MRILIYLPEIWGRIKISFLNEKSQLIWLPQYFFNSLESSIALYKLKCIIVSSCWLFLILKHTSKLKGIYLIPAQVTESKYVFINKSPLNPLIILIILVPLKFTKYPSSALSTAQHKVWGPGWTNLSQYVPDVPPYKCQK